MIDGCHKSFNNTAGPCALPYLMYFDVKREVGESVSKTVKGVEHLHLASHSVCLQYQAIYSHVMMSNQGTVVKRNQPIESRRLSSGFPITALRMQRKQPYQ